MSERFLMMALSKDSGSNPRPGRNYYSLEIRPFASSDDMGLKPTVL